MDRFNQKIILDIRNSYLKMIENSIGTKLFRNFYIYQKGIKKDAQKNGELSCAFFVSFILHNFELIKYSHLTVVGTIKDMKKSGWIEIKKPKQGAILIWQEKKIVKEFHKHIGFYIGRKQAISNSFRKKIPVCHHWTMDKKGSKFYRRVITIFWHKKLEQKFFV